MRSQRVKRPFALEMRDRQLRWAIAAGIPESALEQRSGKTSWVLKREHQSLNLFRPEWWTHIAASEHHWARALNSSQCFGLNLFGPLADDPSSRHLLLAALLPDRRVQPNDSVAICFEHTPPDGPEWLGESKQATQVDVFFQIKRENQPLGFVLVEVKFTETGFGSCRGWNGSPKTTRSNPDRGRCLDAQKIVASPEALCWIAEVEQRRYWESMSHQSSSLRIAEVARAGACPFRHGLYQLMRNRILADELASKTHGAWSDFAVCSHPDNDALLQLEEPVAGSSDAIASFRALSSKNAVRTWRADELVDLISSHDERLKNWADWMRSRYFSS